MYKRMLVPLDGSELAEKVFPYAKELAGRLDLDVILLHISPPEESDLVPMHRAYIERAAEMIKQQTKQAQKRAGIQPGAKAIEVKGEVTVGYPPEEVLRYADKQKADFILIATHGRSGISRWAIGSMAEKILRAAKVPVVLVHSEIADQIPYDKWPKKAILAPLDGSTLAESVLPHVEALAKQQGTEPVDVVLLRVCEPPVMPTYYAPELSGVPLNWGQYMEQETARSRQVAKEYLAGVEERLKGVGVKARSEILVGNAADEIINYIKKNPFTLVVIATHGRSGLGRLVYGSVAATVLRGATSPILWVKPS